MDVIQFTWSITSEEEKDANEENVTSSVQSSRGRGRYKRGSTPRTRR